MLGAQQFRRYLERLPAHILETNPHDSKNADGTPFWQGDKRPPRVLKLDSNDDACRQFIFSFAELFGRALGLQFNNNNNADK